MITRRRFIQHAAISAGLLLLPAGPPRVRAAPVIPGYGRLHRQGRLRQRIDAAMAILSDCRLCPRQCGVDRLAGERGFCGAPAEAMVYSAHPHFGEERSLSGTGGSGTIFFSNCNLRCMFCQNWPISIRGLGRRVTDLQLADMMLDLQHRGCHNINLVTPTHVMPRILAAVDIARTKGLRLPLVYNTSGYERVEILRLLDGIVDVYLPDMKYMAAAPAARYSSGAADYPQQATAAVLEMYRQVGGHRVDESGIATGGLMIRHLVMPNRVAGTRAFVKWVAGHLPLDTYVNIMAQYHVDYRAYDDPVINRGISAEEFVEAMEWAEDAGLTHLDPDSVSTWQRFRRQPGNAF